MSAPTTTSARNACSSVASPSPHSNRLHSTTVCPTVPATRVATPTACVGPSGRCSAPSGGGVGAQSLRCRLCSRLASVVASPSVSVNLAGAQ
jgi:hypothetical protein